MTIKKTKKSIRELVLEELENDETGMSGQTGEEEEEVSDGTFEASSMEKVSEIIENNPDKQIVLMTHHCLSPRCISEDYVSDALNASYVTDREKWIEDHPNVRLILSGHIHHRTNFKIGDTLYVLNPLGYCQRDFIQYKKGLKPDDWRNRWTPNCFVDTNTWELTYEEWDSSEWDRKLDAYYKAIHDYGIFF